MKTAEQRRKAGGWRSWSFSAFIIIPFCTALLLQGILGYFVITQNGGIAQFEADSYGLFSGRTVSRATYLENDMVLKRSNVDLLADSVQTQVWELLNERGSSAEDVAVGSSLSVDIINHIADQMVSYTRFSEVDGLYVILENGSDGDDPSNKRDALYLRDSNPLHDPGNSSDLLLAAGPLSTSRELGIALDSNWSSTFSLSEDPEDNLFLTRPLQVAEDFPQATATDLGFWGHPVDFGGKGSDSITYSVPLRDGAGKAFGVIGIEVELSRIMGYLPQGDFGPNDIGSFLFGVTSGPERDGVLPVGSGERAYEIFGINGMIASLYVDRGILSGSVDSRGYVGTLFTVTREVNPAVLSPVELVVYDPNSPYADEHWVVTGLVQENTLFAASNTLARNLLAAFIASLAVGAAIAILTARLSSSRIRHLVDQVRLASPEKPLSFSATGISEVDELADSVKSLSFDVAASASKLSQVMMLSNRSVGAFDYKIGDDSISFTKGFFDIFGAEDYPDLPEEIDRECLRSDVMGADEFRIFMKSFGPYMTLEDEDGLEEGSYRVVIELLHRKRWVRFATNTDVESFRVVGIVEDVTREIQTRMKIEHERDHDVLTGLYNRRAFDQSVRDQLFEYPEDFGAMLVFDLDNLKYINDLYGHDWGDRYIVIAAEALKGVRRATDICARPSGDEFFVYLREASDPEEVLGFCTLLQRSFETSFLETPDGELYRIRASTGVAFYPDHAQDYEHLREYADFAMYMAKHSRKGEACIFDRESYDEKSYILSKKEELNRLIDENLIDYHFQPIISAKTGDVHAYEALMRPRLASLSRPDLVLDLARSQSKLYQIERMTFYGALETFSAFDQPDDVLLFINSIGTQRLSIEDEMALKQRYKSLVGNTVIEITENDCNQELFGYKQDLAKRWGAKLAIDDFGSGYSNDFMLLSFSADYVKIDMSLIHDIDTDVDRQDILKGILSYAHDRKIKVIAEGVETEGELVKLVSLGIDFLQGYLLGRPAGDLCAAGKEAVDLIKTMNNGE